jgi:hypothetical protein
MSMPMFTRPRWTVEEERKMFEPIYDIQIVRKWKLDKLKTIIDERKKGIKFGDIHYDNSHIFGNDSSDNIMCTFRRYKKKTEYTK